MHYRINLSDSELIFLENLANKPTTELRVYKRAKILLYSHHGESRDYISDKLDVCVDTITNIRRKYRNIGLEAVNDQKRSGMPLKFDEIERALVIGRATQEKPQDRVRNTVTMIHDNLVNLDKMDISRATVHRIMKENTLYLYKKNFGATPI